MYSPTINKFKIKIKCLHCSVIVSNNIYTIPKYDIYTHFCSIACIGEYTFKHEKGIIQQIKSEESVCLIM